MEHDLITLIINAVGAMAGGFAAGIIMPRRLMQKVAHDAIHEHEKECRTRGGYPLITPAVNPPPYRAR